MNNRTNSTLRRRRPAAIADTIHRQTPPTESTPDSQASTNSAVESRLQRMVADAAHDLRSPLTGIRESIRLIKDVTPNSLTGDQVDCVDIAIEQCGVMQHLIDSLLRPECGDAGVSPARRSWIGTQALFDSMQRLIAPTLASGCEVFWDGAIVGDRTVFADATIMQRLIGNLINNAAKVSAAGSPILVRAFASPTRDTLRWSVIDRGPGMSPTELQQIVQRRVSHQGGHGLGLSICAQLAELHFSRLDIASSPGVGTEVSFETPALGPASVAEAWSIWRTGYLSDRATPMAARRGNPTSAAVTDAMSRIDGAQTATPRQAAKADRRQSDCVSMRAANSSPRSAQHAVAGTVTLGAAHTLATADVFDKCFQFQMGMFDLVYRVDARKWVWIFDTPVDKMESRLRSISSVVNQELSKRQTGFIRLHWSNPQQICLTDRRMKARISDLLIRETLQANSQNRGIGHDEVRLGTRPISLSPVAAARLEEELVRLSGRLKSQSSRLLDHAGMMRQSP